ncbi:hypothetical protein [Sulfurovum sp.]|uniref:hypothetical protein n=1 Tax=Sulfurovum sp. TaxID=1969726 RepID=UPI0035623515
MKDFFENHRGRNDISIEQHIRSKQIALSENTQGKYAIYLDIKYWISLCEASLARSKCDTDYKLLNLATELNEKGIAFFPISETTYAELMKQEDHETREKTSILIDKLSDGIALVPYEIRIKTEIAHAIHYAIEPESIYPLKKLVWTKVSNVLGYTCPTNTIFDEENELLIQKVSFDYLWELSLTDITSGDRENDISQETTFEALSNYLNENNEKYSSELRSYEQTYLNEIAGVIDLFSDTAREVINKMAERRGITVEQDPDAGMYIINIFREAYRKGTINKDAPTLDVFAHCHTAVRWNKRRKIKPNDIFDFYHAAAALGYCDAFFTERSLCNLLTEKKTSLDKVHKCKVLYKESDAVTYMQTLLS